MEEIIDSYLNGNISVLLDWVRKHSKVEMLDLIETGASMGVQRHMIINTIRNGL